MKKLAVLMPTYNCAKYINEAIDSILNQSFALFDLYIYDDCSNDETAVIISKHTDNRIFYIKNEQNLGIAKTLNSGLEKLLPNYEYIARMDADDWSFPDRFEKQIKFMEQNQHVAICGTQGYWLKDFSKLSNKNWLYPTANNYLQIYLLFAASFGHSSIILRTSIFLKERFFYNQNSKTCEDWDLWSRITKKYQVANLPDFLMKYRVLDNSNHRAASNQLLHFQERCVVISNLFKFHDIDVDKNDVFDFFYNQSVIAEKQFYALLLFWIKSFNKLYQDNQEKLTFFEKKDLSYLMARKISTFWKRSGKSKYNLRIWLLIFKNIKFINYYKLFKSQIK